MKKPPQPAVNPPAAGAPGIAKIQVSNPPFTPAELGNFSTMEPWKRELAEFVIEAERLGKSIRCKYQGFTLTPEALAHLLMLGRFVWGVVNWEMVERTGNEDWK